MNVIVFEPQEGQLKEDGFSMTIDQAPVPIQSISALKDAETETTWLFVVDLSILGGKRLNKAQEVLNKINSGELSFEDAAAQYSDDSSKDKGGDVGWSNQGFVSEYLTAVDGLDLNQVSGLVESQFGIHIIKVTDVYTAPEEITSLDQLPEDFREGIRNAAAATKAQNDYNDWLTGLRDAATFTQNDMPSGLPYDVDMEKYQKRYEEMVSAYQSETGAAEGTEEGADAEGAEGTGEAAASEESASSDSASSDSAN